MKVFFSSSISRSRAIIPLSQDIVREIQSLSHEVLTKHLVDPEYSNDPQWDKKLDPQIVYSDAEQRLNQADVLITECTTPSFAAGWWIDKCLAKNKPLLTLHYGETMDHAPIMIRGRAKEINLHMYTEDTLNHVLQQFFDSLPAT
jgi:hypothetical protein